MAYVSISLKNIEYFDVSIHYNKLIVDNNKFFRLMIDFKIGKKKILINLNEKIIKGKKI